jgi:hypothetical protein
MKKSDDNKTVLFIAPAILGDTSKIIISYLFFKEISSKYLCKAEVAINHL